MIARGCLQFSIQVLNGALEIQGALAMWHCRRSFTISVWDTMVIANVDMLNPKLFGATRYIRSQHWLRLKLHLPYTQIV